MRGAHAVIDGLILLRLSLGGLVLGLAPLLLAERCLGLINHLFVLLFVIYSAFFLSLGLLPTLTGLMARRAGLQQLPRGLRAALLAEAVGLSAVWYKLLNPFPLQALLANQQYLPTALILLVLLLAWLLFFIIKKNTVSSIILCP